MVGASPQPLKEALDLLGRAAKELYFDPYIWQTTLASATTLILICFVFFYYHLRDRNGTRESATQDKHQKAVSEVFGSYPAIPGKFREMWEGGVGDSRASCQDRALSGDSVAGTLASLIRKRRSIFPKDFTGEQVPFQVIQESLAAANWAPTHGKTEPWRFVVAGPSAIQKILTIRDDFMTKHLTQKGDVEGLERHRKKMQKKRKELTKCSAIIFIIVKRVPNRKGRFMPEWEEIAAVSCAVQNFHLQITARWDNGVGGYWSSGGFETWLRAPKLHKMLGINESNEEGAEQGDGKMAEEKADKAPSPRDLVLGGFYLGCCSPAKMQKYRASRGDVNKKVNWIY